MENHSLIYEGKSIPFLLNRKNVKNINLRVRPDAVVLVSANRTVSYEYIEQFVREKAPWIIQKIKYFEEKRSSIEMRKYITGEIISFLGRQYSLKVIWAKKREEVILDHDKVFLFVKDESDFARKEKLIKAWYKEEASRLFLHSMERVYPKIAGFGIKKPTITVRSMKTRWGSCSINKQKITLNSELVKTTEACIDYVVLHELAHFRYRKHDAQFYRFLEELMPGWKEQRNFLKKLSYMGIL